MGRNVKAHCALITNVIDNYLFCALGEWVVRMWFSKEHIFPNSKGNSKVTITVRFIVLIDLSCVVSVIHVNTV